MVEDLADDHEQLARRLRTLARLAENSHDLVTADLATERLSFHEKAIWMLRAILVD
jgi:starvation-inducible DNA-binding protein